MTDSPAISNTAAASHLLADSGTTDYVIVVADDAAPPVRRAANDLGKYLAEVSGADFPIVSDDTEMHSHELVVGENRHTEALDVSVDGFGLEEFVVRSCSEHIVVAGGNPRGTLYAAYQLLDDIGVRWYTRSVTHVPQTTRLVIPQYDLRTKPHLEYREPFFQEGFEAEWAAHNRVNTSHASLGKEHGGKVAYGQHAFVHTFDTLVPIAEHFKVHPEYFSLIDGKRTDDHTQLCLTNPEVLRLSIEGVRRWIRDEPEATIFTVSQNDWLNPCQCDNCSAIDEREGSHAGSMLWFVNQVAEAIEDEAPHVAIDTLAYQYTRKPPKTIRPRPNVIVRLCSIECCFAHTLESCPVNTSFVEDVRGWSEFCDRLYVWDYVTNFMSYLLPWPNFNVLGPNVRFYARYNVVGLFEQGSYSSGGGGELAELRAYTLARLLWNPEINERDVMNEFIDGVYGQAADHVRQYLALIHEPIADDDIHMHIFCDFDNPHIRSDLIHRGSALLDEAEAAAESDEVRQRMERVHMSTWYTLIRMKQDDDPERAVLLERFLSVAQREGVVDIGEGRSIANWVETGARTPIYST
jgi:hypothetical protein